MSILNISKQNTTTKSKINTDNNINSVDDAFKPENYLTILKVENISLNSEIKKLNDMISKLKKQLTNYNAEKIILLQNSSKKEIDIKSLKEKLFLTKNELSSLKQKMGLNEKSNINNIYELQTENEQLIKNREIAKNQLTLLQNKITALEYELKQQETPSNHNFISNLEKSRNISLVLPSLQKYKSSSDIFLTEYEKKNQIINLKNEIMTKENEKIKIENELQTILKERNKLILLLKEKNEEIQNKLNLQNKLSNELLEQIDKNKIYKSGYKEAKLKNQNLERDKKALENVIILQEGKVLQMSASIDKINKMLEIKNTEICKNQKNIQNLEEVIKDFQKKFRNLKNKENKSKVINGIRKQIDNLRIEYKKQLVINRNMRSNNLIINNNISNINHFLNKNKKSNSKIQIINNRYKLLENINKFDKIEYLKYKKQKKIRGKTGIPHKFKKYISADANNDLYLNNNKKIKNFEYNSIKTDNDIGYINSGLKINTDNINTIIPFKIKNIKKLPIIHSLSSTNSKLKISYNEKNEQKDKENFENFKIYFNQFVSDMEKA